MALINTSHPYYGHLYNTIPNSSSTGRVGFGQYFNNDDDDQSNQVIEEESWDNCSYGSSQIKTENGEYIIRLDVSQFKPAEIDVKTVHHCIIVEGHHEERPDVDEDEEAYGQDLLDCLEPNNEDDDKDEVYGYDDTRGQVTRSFTRKYIIPSYCKAGEFIANISSDGWLTLKAPIYHHHLDELKEKIYIPINVVA